MQSLLLPHEELLKIANKHATKMMQSTDKQPPLALFIAALEEIQLATEIHQRKIRALIQPRPLWMHPVVQTSSIVPRRMACSVCGTFGPHLCK